MTKRRTFIVHGWYESPDYHPSSGPVEEIKVRATSAEHAEDLASRRRLDLNCFEAVSPAHLCPR